MIYTIIAQASPLYKYSFPSNTLVSSISLTHLACTHLAVRATSLHAQADLNEHLGADSTYHPSLHIPSTPQVGCKSALAQFVWL